MQNAKLYVGNFDYAVTDEQLKTLFAPYGEVKQVTIISGRGFGFVEMTDAAMADAAKEALNGADFQGRTLKIDTAREQAPRRRDYDGGGGGYGDRRGSSGSRGGRDGGGFRGGDKGGQRRGRF